MYMYMHIIHVHCTCIYIHTCIPCTYYVNPVVGHTIFIIVCNESGKLPFY